MEEDKNSRGPWTSASNADADLLCKARHLLQKKVNSKEEKDESSEFGTDVHKALASQDPSWLDLEKREVYDACLEIEDAIVQKYFDGEFKGAPIRERRLWLESGELKHSAQVDVVRRLGTKALIIEYKSLAGVVPASPRNLQLRDQVCCFYGNSSLLQEVAVAVIQPYVTRSPGLCIYSQEDIQKSTIDLWNRVSDSNTPEQPRTPSETACKFCRAKSICKEYNSFASSIVLTHTSLVDVPVSEWTPIMRTNFMDRMPTASKWLEDCKEQMKALLKADANAIPGYRLGKPKVTETITDAQAVFDSFSKKGGTLEQYMKTLKVGKTKLKEALAEVTKTKGKQLDANLTEVIGSNSTKSESEPSIERIK